MVPVRMLSEHGKKIRMDEADLLSRGMLRRRHREAHGPTQEEPAERAGRRSATFFCRRPNP